MGSTLTPDDVMETLAELFGDFTSQTAKVRRWDRQAWTVNAERRGVRHVNIWMAPPAALSDLPPFAKLYPCWRTRNWQLSDPLCHGNPVVCLPVSTPDHLGQILPLLRRLMTNHPLN